MLQARRTPLCLRPVVLLVATLALAGFGSVIAPPQAFATTVSGHISGSTTWTTADSPVVDVEGDLQAVGTPSARITFTSVSDTGPGGWMGLSFQGARPSVLRYVDVRDGGGPSGASEGLLWVTGNDLTVEDSTVQASSNAGMMVAGGVASPAPSVTVRRTMFRGNGVSPDGGTGDGIKVVNALVRVEDSALWRNGSSGIEYLFDSSYQGASPTVSGTSIWKNGRDGVSFNIPRNQPNPPQG